MNRWTFGFKIFFGVIFCGLILGAAVMLLWNWLMPELFHASEINFVQALGLLALSKILFGFKSWKKGCCGCGHGHGSYKGYWKKRWEEKIANMSPEEKEKLKEKYKRCCGFDEEPKQG